MNMPDPGRDQAVKMMAMVLLLTGLYYMYGVLQTLAAWVLTLR